MHDTGTSSIVYVRYWYYQYCNITILVFLVLYSVTILVIPVSLQYWYFQYYEYYNTGNTSIVNITILVIPVSRPAASYYPIFSSNFKMLPKFLTENCNVKLFFSLLNLGLAEDFSSKKNIVPSPKE